MQLQVMGYKLFHLFSKLNILQILVDIRNKEIGIIKFQEKVVNFDFFAKTTSHSFNFMTDDNI